MKSRLKRILSRMPRSLLSAAVLGATLLLMVAGVKNYHQLQIARQREAELQDRLQQRRQAVEALDGQLVRLRQDPVALERLARENLGMAHADELVFILPGGRGSTPTEPGPTAPPASPAGHTGLSEAPPVPRDRGLRP